MSCWSIEEQDLSSNRVQLCFRSTASMRPFCQRRVSSGQKGGRGGRGRLTVRVRTSEGGDLFLLSLTNQSYSEFGEIAANHHRLNDE